MSACLPDTVDPRGSTVSGRQRDLTAVGPR
jgi:hypothetical protein